MTSSDKNFKNFITLAQQGDVAAQTATGTACFFGRGTPKDFKKALEWYTKVLFYIYFILFYFILYYFILYNIIYFLYSFYCFLCFLYLFYMYFILFYIILFVLFYFYFIFILYLFYIYFLNILYYFLNILYYFYRRQIKVEHQWHAVKRSLTLRAFTKKEDLVCKFSQKK